MSPAPETRKQLNVRDPRAADLARTLARLRGQTMTEATIFALETAIEQERTQSPLPERLAALAKRAQAMRNPGGRDITKADLDALWGQ